MAHQRQQKSGSDAAEFKHCKSRPDSQVIARMVDNTGAPITRPALNSELRHCGVHLPVRKSFLAPMRERGSFDYPGQGRRKSKGWDRDGMSPSHIGEPKDACVTVRGLACCNFGILSTNISLLP